MNTPSPHSNAAIPPVVRRLSWWMALPLAWVVVGFGLFRTPTVQSVMATPNLWVALGIPAYFFAPLFGAIFAMARGQRRIKRAVLAANGRACVHCLYDLSTLPDTGACPECGRAFDSAADQRSWARVGMTR